MDSISQNQTQLLPTTPSTMAEALSNLSSRPGSSHGTPTNISNNSTTSLASTLSTSSTPAISKWDIYKPQYDSKGQKLDAMSRKYHVPEKELSLDEMLALPPLPRTFWYEIQKDDVVRIKKESEQKRKQELDAAKKLLKDLALAVK